MDNAYIVLEWWRNPFTGDVACRGYVYDGAALRWMHDGEETRTVERKAREFAQWANLRITSVETRRTPESP